MPIIKLADASLNYRFDGPEGAPVLVLSNSLGTDLHMWDDQIPAFAEHFHVLRYDDADGDDRGQKPCPTQGGAAFFGKNCNEGPGCTHAIHPSLAISRLRIFAMSRKTS